ncbi:MAG: TetR/AcrR family transcriptional regulator [Burkholderiaceae bacterium]
MEGMAAEAKGKGRIRLANEADILQAAEQVFARAGFAGATMAEIAERAGIPKSNLHYYFGTKREIYRAVLAHILALWLAPTDSIREDNDPGAALSDYIEAKMRLSATRPDASRVFASEVLHGATEIGDILRGELRAVVERKAAVIERWIADGRMAPVDPRHLFFTIWAATQTYADFEAQVCAVLDVRQLDDPQIGAATRHLKTLLLRGCGLA